MSKTELAKKIVNVIVTVGTGKIVSDVIKNNTNPESAADMVTYTAGSYAIGGLVASETSKYTDRQIDELVDWWNENIKKN